MRLPSHPNAPPAGQTQRPRRTEPNGARRIVVATDFSLRSHRAVRRAGLLARHWPDAELLLLHATGRASPPERRRTDETEAMRMLSEQIGAVFELRGLRCHPVVVPVDPAEAILRTAAVAHPDLIVIGAHRKRPLRDMVAETTAESVLRGSRCPVLVVNGEVNTEYRSVLAPVDTLPLSVNAIRTATSLRLMDDARVTLLHAFAAPGKGKLSIAGVSRAGIADYVAAERDRAREAVCTFMASEAADCAMGELLLEEGFAVEVILRAVERSHPDLLVLGTHRRSGIPRFMLGSVTEEILRTVSVDVLAVPGGPAGSRTADAAIGAQTRALEWVPAPNVGHRQPLDADARMLRS
jgi:nucleotide-binding universal stress UspA family protein